MSSFQPVICVPKQSHRVFFSQSSPIWGRNQRAVCSRTVLSNNTPARFLSGGLKADREIVLNALSQSWIALRYASDDLKGDREIVLEAVAQNWQALQWASRGLKGDREVVLNAVSQSWKALKWASNDLKADQEIVQKAVSQDWLALNWASDELAEDQQLIQEIMSQTEFQTEGLLVKVSLYMGKMGSICHFPRALLASIWGHCSQALVLLGFWGTQKGM